MDTHEKMTQAATEHAKAIKGNYAEAVKAIDDGLTLQPELETAILTLMDHASVLLLLRTLIRAADTRFGLTWTEDELGV